MDIVQESFRPSDQIGGTVHPDCRRCWFCDHEICYGKSESQRQILRKRDEEFFQRSPDVLATRHPRTTQAPERKGRKFERRIMIAVVIEKKVVCFELMELNKKDYK